MDTEHSVSEGAPHPQEARRYMNLSDRKRNAYVWRGFGLFHGFHRKRGYMRWWHSFSGIHEETGESRTFFVEYYVINPGLGEDRPILGRHPYYRKRGMKPSYIMIKAGAFPGQDGQPGRQLHAFYPICALNTTGSPLVMQVEDCMYREDRISGRVEVTPEEAAHRSLMSDSGVMEWDLEVHKAVSCHTGFLAGPLFQALNALDSYWHGEGIRSFFRGTVTLDGETYRVSADTSYGYADKHWGRSFNKPWMQLACCRLTSAHTGRELRHSVLAVSSCCPRFFFLPLRRRLLMQLTYTGEDFEFGLNSQFLFTKYRWSARENGKRFIWHVMARNRTHLIKISGTCTKDRMLKLKYESPDAAKAHGPLWAGGSGIGTIEIYRLTKNGRELLDTLRMDDALCEYRGQTLKIQPKAARPRG